MKTQTTLVIITDEGHHYVTQWDRATTSTEIVRILKDAKDNLVGNGFIRTAVVARGAHVETFDASSEVAANAARIVQCVNAHDELVAALTDLYASRNLPDGERTDTPWRVVNLDHHNTLPGGAGMPHDRAVVLSTTETTPHPITGEAQPLRMFPAHGVCSLAEANEWVASAALARAESQSDHLVDVNKKVQP